MKTNVGIFGTEEVQAGAAAEYFVRCARSAARERGVFKVAFSGGHTPERLFRLLADEDHRDLVDWSSTHAFWADERPVPPSHPDSNYRLAHELLLRHVPIPESHVHRVPAETGPGAAVIYEQHLREIFRALEGTDDWPHFDLVLLGLGPDGHTASLMPDAEFPRNPLAWVIEPWVPHLNSHRISLTDRAINHAREVLFLVSGERRASAVSRVLEGPIDLKRLPAQRIRPRKGTLTWYLDGAAASRLKSARVA